MNWKQLNPAIMTAYFNKIRKHELVSELCSVLVKAGKSLADVETFKSYTIEVVHIMCPYELELNITANPPRQLAVAQEIAAKIQFQRHLNRC
jgi:hypothetical protein